MARTMRQRVVRMMKEEVKRSYNATVKVRVIGFAGDPFFSAVVIMDEKISNEANVPKEGIALETRVEYPVHVYIEWSDLDNMRQRFNEQVVQHQRDAKQLASSWSQQVAVWPA